MINTFLTGIRQQVTAKAHEAPATDVSYLRIDSHTAASLLQKSIRRGRDDLALKAGQRLFDLQPSRLWRRLAVTLFEDVGLLDKQLALDLIACAPRRDSMPVSWTVVARLVRQLCNAAKTQVANNLLHICIHDIDEATPLEGLGLLSFEEAARWITSDTATLVQRAKAVWQLSGMACDGQVIRHPSADRERVIAILADLSADPILEVIAREGVRLTGHVLPLVSVLEPAVGRQSSSYVVAADPMPPEQSFSGMPSWVFDQYTRAGKVALRRAVSECPSIAADLAARALTPGQRFKALADAHFELESANLSHRAQMPAHMSLLRRVQGLGPLRAPETADSLYEAFRADWEGFQSVRREVSLRE